MSLKPLKMQQLKGQLQQQNVLNLKNNFCISTDKLICTTLRMSYLTRYVIFYEMVWFGMWFTWNVHKELMVEHGAETYMWCDHMVSGLAKR